MRKLLLIGLLALAGLSACKLLSRSGPLTAEVIEVDSLTFTAEQLAAKKPIEIAKGVLVTPISRTQAILTQPAPKSGKVKYKNVGNTEVKSKVVDKSTVKDKSKEKEKTKADIIGNGNTQQEAGTSWWAWVLVGALIAAALYLRYR